MRVVASLLVVGLAVACAGGRPGTPSPATAVEVRNQAFADMTVYVVESTGSRRRIGFAPGASTIVMRIPSSLIGMGREVHFVVDPIGSTRTAMSNRMFVSPGDTVMLTIPPG